MTLLEQATLEGLELSQVGQRLRVLGPDAVLERWLPTLRERRAELLAELATQQVLDEVAHALSDGVIDPADAEQARQSIAVHCADPASVQEWKTLIRWCMAARPGPAGLH
jgi:hypothetical protein